MSSGEEFEVEEILEQRKRKGVLEYLVHWKGFNDLYNTWEPAESLADCTRALKAFVAKQSRSRSRSRSRGRLSKSRSRSSSRGRSKKTDTTPKRSRSRSEGRKSTKSSSSKTSTVASVTKVESSPAEQQKSKLRSGTQATEQKASSKEETVTEKTSTSKEGKVVERKTEVIKTTVETVKSTPTSRGEGSDMTTRSRLPVRQVQNDQQSAPKVAETKGGEKGTWLWWFADHAVLVLFVIVSLIALSFTIESISGVRDKLVPDLGVLRQRLGESYHHFVQGVSTVCGNVVDAVVHGFAYIKAAIFFTGENPAPAPAQDAPPQQTSA